MHPDKLEDPWLFKHQVGAGDPHCFSMMMMLMTMVVEMA